MPDLIDTMAQLMANAAGEGPRQKGTAYVWTVERREKWRKLATIALGCIRVRASPESVAEIIRDCPPNVAAQRIVKLISPTV